MSPHGFESMKESMEKLLGSGEVQALIEAGQRATEDEPVEMVCPRCKGSGWLRYNVNPGVPEFGRIIECRCGIVVGRRAAKLWGTSMIPAEYAELDLATYPDSSIALDVRRWYSHGERPWLLLVGDFGVGKTGLAIGLIKLALAEGRPAVFRVVPELLTDIKATYGLRAGVDGPAEVDLLSALKGVDLLALDDLGAERMTGWVEERLFEVLNHRHNERKRTIITTNLDPDELQTHVGERIFWRVMGMSWRFEILGSNLRLRRA